MSGPFAVVIGRTVVFAGHSSRGGGTLAGSKLRSAGSPGRDTPAVRVRAVTRTKRLLNSGATRVLIASAIALSEMPAGACSRICSTWTERRCSESRRLERR